MQHVSPQRRDKDFAQVQGASTNLNTRNQQEGSTEDCTLNNLLSEKQQEVRYFSTLGADKVVFEKESLKLLGTQIVGSEGVDKRLDVLATAIHCGMKADMLKDLDLAYAPPFSSAKDPVNMAGFMIENISKGMIKQYHWDGVKDLPRDGSVTLLDTRTAYEYKSGHIDGYINIPVDDLRDRINELDRSKTVYVICQSGLRSYIACRILSQNGFDCYNFSGGYRFYTSVIKEKEMSEYTYPCGMEK